MWSVWRYTCIRKQAVTTRWRMEYKTLEIHWSLDPKNWRNQEDNDIYNQKHRGILTSVQQLKLEELHLFGIAFYFFKFLLLHQNFQRLNFFSSQVFKKIFTLKNYFCFSLKLDNLRRYNFFCVSLFLKFYKWLRNAKRNCLRKWGCPF